MIILLFGNIGSGKTSLANALVRKTGYAYYAIDEYRKKYSDGSHQGEEMARKYFLETLSKRNNIIIEALGVGSLSDQLYQVLADNWEEKLIVVLDVPEDICLRRISTRKWDIPFPESFGSPHKILHSTHRRLIIEKGYTNWLTLKNSNLKIFKNISETDANIIINYITRLVNEPRN